MKLLVFGESGQVARELARRHTSDAELVFLGRDKADLSEPEACAKWVFASDFDAAINVAAWTAVDRAEAEEAAALLVNGVTPGAIARACSKRGIPILHLSTDYVFDGLGTRPFSPSHATSPINAYGRTKLAGEVAIRASGARHVILRTSWVVSSHGTNFVKTMLRLGAEREKLNVVADQIGSPTPAADIADALMTVARNMVEGHLGGTYHFACNPDVSWADLARTIMESANLSCRIFNIPSSAYPTPAKRPLNSRLDCSTFTREFGIRRPDWRDGLTDILRESGVLH